MDPLLLPFILVIVAVLLLKISLAILFPEKMDGKSGEQKMVANTQATKSDAHLVADAKPKEPEPFTMPVVQGELAESSKKMNAYLQKQNGAELLTFIIEKLSWKRYLPQWQAWLLFWEQEAMHRLDQEIPKMGAMSAYNWLITHQRNVVSVCYSSGHVKGRPHRLDPTDPEKLCLDWETWFKEKRSTIDPQIWEIEKERKKEEERKKLIEELGFEGYSRLMFGYDDDYDANDPRET